MQAYFDLFIVNISGIYGIKLLNTVKWLLDCFSVKPLSSVFQKFSKIYKVERTDSISTPEFKSY